MGVYINPGYEKFNMAIHSEIYVDKTGLISEMNKLIRTEQRFVCVSRPRRFGKSMAANMLTAYYGKGCDSTPLFANFEIAKQPDYEKYKNQFHVISINMQNFYSNAIDTNEMIDKLQKKLLIELGKVFTTVEIDDLTLSEALEQIYAQTGEMFIVIIDEWDCVMREKKDADVQIRSYLSFLRDLLKDRVYVALAYITGILPIKKYGTHSELNMFEEYSMISSGKMAPYVGLTQKEVEDIAQKYALDFGQMQTWYDGYSLGNQIHVYNPKSVVMAALSGEYKNYWARTETYEALKFYIEMNFDGLRDAVIEMLGGKGVKIDVGFFQNDMTTLATKDDVLTLLVHLGYLAFEQDSSIAFIPNQEVREEFRLAIEGAKWEEVAGLIKRSDEILKATWDGDATKVAEMIDEVHMENTSILTFNDENSLACVISLAYYNAVKEYTLIREFPTGKGFADIVFFPKKQSGKPAMIVELKYDKDTNSAIKQIKEKKYPKGLQEYEGNLLLVGINYDKTSKRHECLIEKA